MPDHKNGSRLGIAFVANSLTPYGVNLYRAIATGIPELKLHVLLTHWAAGFKWNVDIPSEIEFVPFCHEGENPEESPLRHPLYDWRKGGRLIRYVRENDIRGVIIIGYRMFSLLRLMNYCHRAGMPFFVLQDCNIRSEARVSAFQTFIKRRMYAWWLKRASGAMSMSTLGDQFFFKYGADRRQLYRVPYWPDFDAYAQIDQNRLERFRQKFGLDGRRRYLLFCGRIAPEKRVDLLIDAFAAIANRRPDWDLLIVGDGPLGNDLRHRVPKALRSRVVWTGFLDRDEPALAYHSAEVLVLPSDCDRWALVVQEAMAAGLAVVSSDVVGASYELIDDGISGRIFKAGNLEQLTEAILDVTTEGAISRYRRESSASLAHWRETNNSIAEIRRALTDVRVITPTSTHLSTATAS